jgi:ABC-type branched-subunit amino acid transport system substrate-binding protein
VNDATITLGTLIDPALDRGFTQGFTLWLNSVNTSGGICGRTIHLVGAGRNGVTVALPAAYAATALSSLGFVTLANTTDAAELSRLAGGDGIPAITTEGTSEQLAQPGPVVIGPTYDIMAINALDYLMTAGITKGGPVGVVSDGSPRDQDALLGLRWAATQAKITLDVRTTKDAVGNWGNATAVLVFGAPADTVRVLASVPSTVTVMTDLDGYNEALLAGNPTASAAAAAKRLLLVTATPAYTSDHPGAAAVAGAFESAGGKNPGPRLLEGYAAGTMWGALLESACGARSLTRSGVATAISTIGPAPVDSVLGPTNPSLVVNSHMPATRLSAIAAADPAVPTGLAPVTWLQAAHNIGDYQPGA